METMHIGQLAERAGLSLRTVRHYDEVGLLRPSGRTSGGFRLYTEEDLSRLLVIRRMKPLGFTLEEMAEVLRILDAVGGAGDDLAEERKALAGVIAQTEERRERLSEQLAMADDFLALLKST